MSDSIPGFGAFDKVERIRRGMWVHATSPRPDVGQTPHSVIHRHDKLTVRHYAADPEADKQPLPVVIVPSMINRAYIVDLEPGRSLVEGLANKGHDVYLIDWGIPGQEDADEDVGYVLLTLLHRSILRIRRHAGTRQVHLFGYCMGGTLTAMYTAVRPDPVASLCTLAAPIHFAKGGRFYDLVSPVEVEEAIRADGLVPVESMKPVFQLLDPMGNWSKYEGIDKASTDPDTLRRVMVRERWLEENVPMAGAFAREFVRKAYQEDRLVHGGWQLRGEPVDLSRILCPTLVVACERDFITPKEAALPLVDLVGGPARAEVLQTGHIGVVVGGIGPTVFYPLLDAWFRSPDA